MDKISFEQFLELDLRTGVVVDVEEHPNADKLYLLKVDLGELGVKQLVAGVKGEYPKEQLKGRQVAVIANLEEAEIRGEKSEGMVLAADEDGTPILLAPDRKTEPGTKIR